MKKAYWKAVAGQSETDDSKQSSADLDKIAADIVKLSSTIDKFDAALNDPESAGETPLGSLCSPSRRVNDCEQAAARALSSGSSDAVIPFGSTKGSKLRNLLLRLVGSHFTEAIRNGPPWVVFYGAEAMLGNQLIIYKSSDRYDQGRSSKRVSGE